MNSTIHNELDKILTKWDERMSECQELDSVQEECAIKYKDFTLSLKIERTESQRVRELKAENLKLKMMLADYKNIMEV